MTRKRYTRIVRAVFTAHTREGYIEMITSLAQMTRTPYSEVFAAQAENLRDLYVLRGTPLPREIRRWQEARA
jgi:hypothetical protein